MCIRDRRQGVPRKQVGSGDLLPRKGIQQLFVGKGGGQLLLRHSGGIKAVSYTHLDVYKRQGEDSRTAALRELYEETGIITAGNGCGAPRCKR